MNISQTLLLKIVDFLISGMHCYVNKSTATVLPFPSNISQNLHSLEPWEEVKKIVEDDEANFISFAPMENDEFMVIVHNFIEQEDFSFLKKQIGNLINNAYNISTLFQIIYSSNEYKEKWLYYKHVEYIKWVRNKLILMG